MKKIIIFIFTVFCIFNLYSQNENADQVLIYHHSGDIDFFYTTELDSIICSKEDTLGNTHENYVSQLFYAKDTMLVFSIADIDSVVFGNKNEIIVKNEVKVLNQEHIEWIIRVEGNTIYYKPKTPTSILPKVGDKLYYPESNDLFPYGLAGKVISVTNKNNEIAVEIQSLEYTELFDKYFYAGNINYEVEPNPVAPRRAKEIDTEFKISAKIELGENGEMQLLGGVNINGKVVLDPFRAYYHGDFELSSKIGFDISAVLEESAEYNYTEEIWEQRIPPIAGVLYPSLTFNAFFDAKAEMRFSYEMSRNFLQKISWTRRNGENQFIFPQVTQDEKLKDIAKIDVTLNGTLAIGPQFDLNLCLLGDVLGAQASVKVGPEISGEISMGLLTELSQSAYNATGYGSANLTFSTKVGLGAYLLTREHGLWGDVEKSFTIFESTSTLWSTKFSLFPDFVGTISSASKNDKKGNVVSIATKTNTPVIRPLEVGFQVTEGSDDNAIVLDSVFVDTFLPDTTILQGIESDVEVEATISNKDSLFARPVFHYAGLTIPAATVSVGQDPSILPITSYMTNGSISVISGIPIIGVESDDTTTLHIGNFLPIPSIDTFFVKVNPFIGPIPTPITNNATSIIVGTWSGDILGEKIIVKYNDDMTGELSQEFKYSFNYELNSPQMGSIAMYLDNGAVRVFEIINIIETSMTILDKSTYEIITLTKQN